ncbi:hypothetical protein ATX62_07475 [Oenococcus oeni]|uniref:Uncharacterized protein n=1 Tax=Oenococcus oeni TaxID=1247 RepID=A0A6N4A6J7_OENOE|nr:hypothetical protein [Oenococcus oeni]AVI94710.1 hypothetical protein AX764_07755 [Oenococcus oeni]KGI02415.1 hypothetical protein X293_02995 [Oenococcus oeni IOEB_C52]MDV7686584.1 hypothetical protein [Oenococcus oeni]MDV7714356.1 hypothetical protein [Oenococcus oeni]OIK56396.1 hypothetical protein ATW61_07815 [Oenococcus oeni]
MNEYGIFDKKDLLDGSSAEKLIVSGETANHMELQDLPTNENYEELFDEYDEITVQPDGKIIDVYKGEKPSYDCA